MRASREGKADSRSESAGLASPSNMELSDLEGGQMLPQSMKMLQEIAFWIYAYLPPDFFRGLGMREGTPQHRGATNLVRR
jgi:hypothetical protein